MLQIIARASFQHAAVTLLRVLQLEHQNAEIEVTHADAGIILAALAPQRNLAVMAIAVVARCKPRSAGKQSICIYTRQILCVGHKCADAAVRCNAFRQRNKAIRAVGAIKLGDVFAIISNGEPPGLLGNTNHTSCAGKAKIVVHAINSLDINFAIIINFIIDTQRPKRRLNAKIIRALHGICARSAYAKGNRIKEQFSIRTNGFCELRQFHAVCILVRQKREPTIEQLLFGIQAIIGTLPPTLELGCDISRRNACCIQSIIILLVMLHLGSKAIRRLVGIIHSFL